MFSTKFSSIIDRMPMSAGAIGLIAQYLEDASKQQRLHKLRLELRQIKRIGELESSNELAAVVALLLEEHVLRRVVVVQSPAGGAVAEFNSYDEVPETLHDHLRDTEMRVTPSDLRTVYVAVQ